MLNLIHVAFVDLYLSYIMLLCCVTIVVVSQLHVQADAVRQRTQVLHQSVELPHQQDAGLLGVAT